MDWRRFYPDTEERRLLTEVSHVTHIHAGLNVFSDGRIRAGLVYDESKLRRDRIQVVWFSPNEWRYGYRYGNVRLDFDWKNLVRGRNAYWVEAITRYRPTACRILITDVNRDDNEILVRYDPATDEGPWVYDAARDEHYWNAKFTLEVLLERDVTLTEATRLGFVAHHREYCSIEGSCPDGLQCVSGTAGARFLAAAIGRRLPVPRALVFEGGREVGGVMTAISNLRCRLRELHADSPTSGNITSEMAEAEALARAALTYFGNYQDDDARAVAGLFESDDELLTVFKRVLPDFGGVQWRH